MSAYDLQGNPIERTVDGFLGRILQHENDHLDGVLFIDRLTEEGKRELLEQLDILETDYRSKQETNAIPPDSELIARLQKWHDQYT